MFSNRYNQNLSQEINAICTPLFTSTAIDYFLYLRLYSDGTRAVLTTHYDFVNWIYNQQQNISGSSSSINPGIYITKDFVNALSKADTQRIETQITGARKLFNIDLIENGFYIIRKENVNYCEMFEFAASPQNYSLIHFYLNNIDILNHFILYFKDKANKLISTVDLNRTRPQHLPSSSFNNNRHITNTIDRSNFFQATPLKRLSIYSLYENIHLTKRELECLTYLIGGYSTKEIAKLLTISSKSVESYLESTKQKLNCSKKSSLIKKAFELNLFDPSYLHWLLFKDHH